MREQLETAVNPEDFSETTPAITDNLRKTGAALLLGGMSAAATASEYSGTTHSLPEAPQLIASSCAHPALGFIGAWAGSALFRNSSEKVRAAAAAAGATISNFATETAQSLIVATPEYVNFLSSRNLPETGKDYLFALGGLGLFLLQSRRQNSNQL